MLHKQRALVIIIINYNYLLDYLFTNLTVFVPSSVATFAM